MFLRYIYETAVDDKIHADKLIDEILISIFELQI